MTELVVIKCPDKGAKHFQVELKIRGDVVGCVDDFLVVQRECHVCGKELEVIR